MYAAIPATASTTAAVDARITVSAVLLTASRRKSRRPRPHAQRARTGLAQFRAGMLLLRESMGGRDGYSVALRARSRTPAVVPTYMSSVIR